MDDERKERLRQLLNDNHKWPTIYMFKFLMQNDPSLMARLKALFDESAEIRTRVSGKGNYVSITVREMIMHADTVFERYEAVSQIEGITAL